MNYSMKTILSFSSCLFLFGFADAQKKSVPSLIAEKQAVIASVQKHEKELIELSNRIWAYAETSMREKQSAAALADYAKANGMRVATGVAKIPTAFIAEFGSGRPIIGILGEYDALPGLSQNL